MSQTDQKNCFIAQDKIFAKQCRATITRNYDEKCIKTQCPNLLTRDVNEAQLCDIHALEWNNAHDGVEIFEIQDNPENNYYEQNVRYRKKLMEFIEKYNRLKSIVVIRKSELLTTFSSRKNKYNEITQKMTVIDEQIERLELEIELENVESNSDEIQHLQDKLDETSKQRDQLKESLTKLEEEITFLKRQNDTCSVNISSMGEITDRLLKDLHIKLDLSDIPADFAPKQGETTEQTAARKIILAEQLKAEKKKNLLQDGLFVLIRIRCDEDLILNKEGKNVTKNIALDVEKKPKQRKGQTESKLVDTITINDNELEIGQYLTSSIYNDKQSAHCSSDVFLKNLSRNVNNRKYYEDSQRDLYVNHRKDKHGEDFPVSKKDYLRKSEYFFNKSISVEKSKIQERIELGINVPTKNASVAKTSIPSDKRVSKFGATFTATTQDPLLMWETFQSNLSDLSISEIVSFDDPDPNADLFEVKDSDSITETKKSKTKERQNQRNISKANLWKLLNKRLLLSKKQELESYEKTLQSGVEFAENSEISFLGGQDPNNLLNAVTIIALGGSGSGKSTAAKALLRYIINIYRDKYQDFVSKSNITISFRQIYENKNGQIVVENMNSFETKFTNNDFKYPYLRTQPYAQDLKDFLNANDTKENDSTKEGKIIQHVLCDSPNCANLVGKYRNTIGDEKINVDDFDAISILKKISKLDNDTEKNRRIRYTLNNKSGSSRSIKIIQITFQSPTQTVAINLADSAGYEDYEKEESKEKLFEYYQEIITNALSIDEFMAGKRTDGIVDELAESMKNEVLKEGIFIRNSLSYIEKMLIKFNTMQKTMKSTNENDKAAAAIFKVDFNKELEKIKPTKDVIDDQEILVKKENGVSWLAPFLPQHSTVIVLAAFKANMNSTETSSAEETLKFVKNLNV